MIPQDVKHWKAPRFWTRERIVALFLLADAFAASVLLYFGWIK